MDGAVGGADDIVQTAAEAQAAQPPASTVSRTTRANVVVNVITSLADAYCYGAEAEQPKISPDGQLVPAKAHRRIFGRGLHRLRDRLRHLDERLQLDNNGLKQEILDLQLNKSLLEMKLQAQRTRQAEVAVERVVEFFGAFERGWLEASLPVPNQTNSQRPIDVERHRLRVDRQQHFIHTALDPAMQFGDFEDGVRVLVSQWRTFSGCIDSFQLSQTRISCLTTVDNPVVVTEAAVTGRLTPKSLCVLFPRLQSDGRLAQRLVGSSIFAPCRLTFYFDASNRIIRHDCEIDTVAALVQILGSLADVAETLRGALCCDSLVWVTSDERICTFGG